MARRLIVSTRCWICGDLVDVLPDKVLKEQPHSHNTEFVVTHLGRKQYLHTKCWNEMIEKQKNKNN